MKISHIEEIRKLDPTVRIKKLLLPTIAALLFLLIGYIFTQLYGFPLDPFITITLITYIPYALYVELYYRKFNIRIKKNAIIIEKGVLIRQHNLIPYSKIQNVTVDRGVLDHLLGIGVIVIETAGQNLKESEGVIEGLRNYEEFVEFLHQMSEKQKEKSTEVEFLNKGNILDKEIIKELREIRKELKKITTYLTKKSKRGKKK